MEEKPIVKPKWLKRLEKESWQAELVVSGVAIFGSLQLPEVLDKLAESLVGWFSGQANFALNLFFTYSYIMVYVLIVAFMAHFVLRAFWIGLVGLNSVFPMGINVEKGNFPKPFLEKFVRESSFEKNLIQGLDDLCSILFAGCAYFVLVFTVINFDVLLLFGIWSLLCVVLPVGIASLIIQILVAIVLFFSLMTLVLNLKFFRRYNWVHRIQYPIFKIGNKPAFHVLYRPIYYLGFTFMTNFSLRKYYLWTGAFMISVMLLAVFRIADSKAVFFNDDDIFNYVYNQSYRMIPENYENLRQPHHGRILSAVVESDRVSGPSLRVFVPIFRNEKENAEKLCGKFESPEGLTRVEFRLLRRNHFFECQKMVHRFFVNDSLYKTTIHAFNHENQGEKGIITYLPTDEFIKGENILKVEKWSADSVYRTMQIPFIFE